MRALARRTASLGDESLELVDRDELRPPRQLDLRDVGEEALERRRADAERLGRLRPCVGESLDPFGFARDHPRLPLGVAELLLDPTTQTAAPRHALHHTRTMTHFRIKMHLCLALYPGW